MFTFPKDDIAIPTSQETKTAYASSQALASLFAENASSDAQMHLSAHFQPSAQDAPESDLPQPVIDLPLPIVRLLMQALQEMAAGNAVTLLPVPAELTTQQAAQMLRMSRPSLIKMLDAGKIPCRKVGAHRRVRTEDALLYLKNERARRARVMEELTAETQRLGLY